MERATNLIRRRSVVVETRSEAALHALNLTRQADVYMYASDTLEKRQSLREHELVVAAIDRWWNCLPHVNPNALLEAQRISKETYVAMCCRMQARGGDEGGGGEGGRSSCVYSVCRESRLDNATSPPRLCIHSPPYTCCRCASHRSADMWPHPSPTPSIALPPARWRWTRARRRTTRLRKRTGGRIAGGSWR